MQVVESFKELFIAALTATAGQVITVLGPLLLLALAMNVASGIVERKVIALCGMRGYLVLFGWIGVPAHECGHMLFCLLFGHGIESFKLFNPHDADGTLGHVVHTYNARNPYQRVGLFFIGIGPILLGSALLYLGAYLLLALDLGAGLRSSAMPHSWRLSGANAAAFAGDLSRELLHILRVVSAGASLSDWKLYAFVYLAIAIGGAIKLSPADLKSAFSGFASIVLILVVANAATPWIGSATALASTGLRSATASVDALLLFAVVINGAIAGVLTVVAALVGDR